MYYQLSTKQQINKTECNIDISIYQEYTIFAILLELRQQLWTVGPLPEM